MGTVNKNGLMDLSMKETLKTEWSKATEFSSGLMGRLMKVSSTSIKLKGTGIMCGLMEESMKAYGKITKCMVKESLLGLMEESLKVSTFSTRKKVEVFSHGLMGGLMMGNGRTVSKKAKAFTDRRMEWWERECGKMVKRFDGLEIQQVKNEFNIYLIILNICPFLFSYWICYIVFVHFRHFGWVVISYVEMLCYYFIKVTDYRIRTL